MICTIISDKHEICGLCKNEHEKYILNIKKNIAQSIWELLCKGYNEYFINCEYGIPLWAAEIIIALKKYNNISLNIVVPFEEQCKNWTEEERNRYYECHEKADSVTIISTHFNKNCYETADEYMISRSDIILMSGISRNVNYYADIYNVPVKRIS